MKSFFVIPMLVALCLAVASSSTRAATENPLVLSNAVGDTIVIPDRQLQTISHIGDGTIWSTASIRQVRLLNGESLTLDGHTLPGEYVTHDSLHLWFYGDVGYPRQYLYEYNRRLSFYLRVRSQRTVGVLYTQTDQLATAALYLKLLREGRNAAVFKGDQSSCEYGVSTHDQQVVEIEGSQRPFRVSWFAYGPVMSQQERQGGLRRIGNRAEWRRERAGPPKPYPVAFTLPAGRAEGMIRLVGAVIVDPIRGRITPVP